MEVINAALLFYYEKIPRLQYYGKIRMVVRVLSLYFTFVDCTCIQDWADLCLRRQLNAKKRPNSNLRLPPNTSKLAPSSCLL